ncbi:MAG TPA: ComEA family DNA-binding protein [Actinoplanes sp.]|nr:ComEA family DNA-binding protein [Actinoplanes sp.]
MPSWPEDAELEPRAEPRRPPVTTSSTAPIEPPAWPGIRPAWGPADSAPAPPAGDPLGGAFSAPARAFGAFDPGRRGAKALAAVAAVVVVIAAFFAWRARPRVDPVPPPPVAAESPAGSTPSAAREVVVSVAGKVGKPGLVRLPPGARVADALSAAGGAQPGIDVALLNPARKLVDGELLLVGVSPPPGAVVAPAAPAAGGGQAPGGPVNLNAATLADLDTLPGVGPVLAQRILDAREAQGGFTAITDLRKVDGIGESRYEQLKDLVTV